MILCALFLWLTVKGFSKNARINELLDNAEASAVQYDYDKAIDIIQDSSLSGKSIRCTQAIEQYRQIMNNLVPVNVTQIPHIFFHSLIVDTSLAFDNDEDADGYNQFMTTTSEFEAILEQLYQNQYVLITPYDAYTETSEGFISKELLLPEGKKPIIISQDDVNYYSYMNNDGFSQRLVLCNGKVQCEYGEVDGTTSIGAYDLIPILDNFIEEHPDFSYHGARAVIAITGYEGVFGYRNVIDTYSTDYEEECRKVIEIVDSLKSNGYVLASHTYGHIHCGKVSIDILHDDTYDWIDKIGSLIGETDILVFPYGEDITSSVINNAYESTQRFELLYNAGFRYFFNVDSSHDAWCQIGSRYFRGARRNIDGFRMYYYGNKMNDLFYDVDSIFDPARPYVRRL